MLLFANPSIPQVGMGRPTTSLSLRPGPSQWGDPVGLLPPQKNKLYVGVSLHTARIILRCPERHPFPLGRANEHRPQQQGTMTNRVRHRASSLFFLVMVEEFLSLRVRDARGVRAFRTTTGRSWADPAPKYKRGIGGRGPGLSYK